MPATAVNEGVLTRWQPLRRGDESTAPQAHRAHPGKPLPAMPPPAPRTRAGTRVRCGERETTARLIMIRTEDEMNTIRGGSQSPRSVLIMEFCGHSPNHRRMPVWPLCADPRRRTHLSVASTTKSTPATSEV